MAGIACDDDNDNNVDNNVFGDVQVGQVSAQVAVNVTAFGVTPLLVYGQPATYTINLATGPGLPSPNVGNAVFQNATNTPLISFPITAGSATSACTGAGCTLVCFSTPCLQDNRGKYRDIQVFISPTCASAAS